MFPFTAIDLSQLPPPEVIEPLDYEAIRAALIADYQARYPAFTAALESEPVVKLLEVAAYRETILRGRINDAARAVLLPFATGADIDSLAAFWSQTRQPNETDAAFRERIHLSLEALSNAGTRGAYTWHARNVPGVRAVNVHSPVPGRVVVVPLGSAAADGTPSPELLAAVLAAVSADDVRALCDDVRVVAPTITPYTVAAELTLQDCTGAEPVLAAAAAAVAAHVAELHAPGEPVRLSGLLAALHRPGVRAVALTSPAADLPAHPETAYHCASIAITQAAP